MDKEEKHTKGYYLGIGLAMGIPIGIPIGMALGNIAFGPAIGALIGLFIGLILEKRFNKEPLQLSKEEMQKQKTFSWILILIGIALFTVFFFGFLFFKD